VLALWVENLAGGQHPGGNICQCHLRKHIFDQYLRQLRAGGWLKSRVNSAQMGNLLKDFCQ
jgi:hypothetical protein